jgi:anthranilate synthase component 1
MYFLDLGELKIAGASPEMLVRLEDDIVENRPIAGTRPRGEDQESDNKMEQELLNDPKERAEHVMLVDLGRNDLGRVSAFGSVEVPIFMSCEKYSHVMHLVSEVKGKLAPGRDAMDALSASFPAGTVSGAPKIRAMQIIDELEPTKRGPYAGAIGYFSFSGSMDTCITIRTIVFSGAKAYFQAGAGIVADSVPEKEFAETVSKAKAMVRALQIAEEGLL